MCEIQFVIGENLTKYTIDDFLHLVEAGSYGNRDATGIFGENGVLLKWSKAFYELPFEKTQQVWKRLANADSRWLVGHNRLATQGNEMLKKNNHPFTNDVCSVVHNGIITNDDIVKQRLNLKYPEHTDSAIIPHLISHYFVDDVDEVEAIKLAMEDLTGSYSIFVSMHASQNLYYLRNSGSVFEFMRAENDKGEVLIYGSTRASNLAKIGASVSNGVFSVDSLRTRTSFSPMPGHIYQILIPEMQIHDVKSFSPKLNATFHYGGGHLPMSAKQDTVWADNTNKGITTTTKSNRQRKREDKKSVLKALGESEYEIEDYWALVMDEMDYLSGLYLLDDNIDAAFQEATVKFNHKGQSVVVENVPETVAEHFNLYLRARTWYPQNTVLNTKEKGMCNMTVSYKEIIDFVANNTMTERHTNTGIITA
jgi:hypothetical protein